MPTFDKSKGKWRGVVKYEGERYQRLFATKKSAKEWEVNKKRELKDQANQTPDDMPLIILCSKYLDYSKLHFSPKMYWEKQTTCQRLVEFCTGGTDPDRPEKNKPLKEITVDMVAPYLEEQAKNRSPNAGNKDRKNLLAMFNWASKRLDTKTNPATKIDRFSHDRKPKYIPPEKDILKLLAAATPEERVFLDCYLNTAARRSEIYRLTWNEDINFERRQIRLGTRKTKDGSMSYEWLPMNETLHNSLMWLYKNRKFKDSQFVFVCDHHGKHYGKPYTTRRTFMSDLCKRAGIERPFGFHALRHFVASILADKHKVSTKAIQLFLRHKSINTTERYIHRLHSDLEETVELLNYSQKIESTPKGTPMQQNRD